MPQKGPFKRTYWYKNLVTILNFGWMTRKSVLTTRQCNHCVFVCHRNDATESQNSYKKKSGKVIVLARELPYAVAAVLYDAMYTMKKLLGYR